MLGLESNHVKGVPGVSLNFPAFSQWLTTKYYKVHLVMILSFIVGPCSLRKMPCRDIQLSLPSHMTWFRDSHMNKGTWPLKIQYSQNTWWHHQLETFSALLAICAGNSPVPGEFPAQRLVTRSFDVFFELRLNKRLSKQSWGWWFETLPCPLWRHSNAMGFVSPKSRFTNSACINWPAIFRNFGIARHMK